MRLCAGVVPGVGCAGEGVAADVHGNGAAVESLGVDEAGHITVEIVHRWREMDEDKDGQQLQLFGKHEAQPTCYQALAACTGPSSSYAAPSSSHLPPSSSCAVAVVARPRSE